MIGGLLADNSQAARNFHHEWAVYDGVEVIGRSQHVQSLIDEGRISAGECQFSGGVSIQPNEGLGRGTTIQNSAFSGFREECTAGKQSAIYIENDQVRNAVFDASPAIRNNTFGSATDRRISACIAINNSPDGWVRYIAIEDEDGTLSGTSPGFYIQDEAAITNFIDNSTCTDTDGCLRFCPGACLRLGIVSISQDLTTRGFQMIVRDGDKAATIDRRSIWFSELQNHLSAQMPIVLPAPVNGQYSISFVDGSGAPAWPGFAKLNLERSPTCSGGLVDSSQVRFDMPLPDGRCDSLFHYDDYAAGVHGWQHFFAGLNISIPEGETSYVISTTRRKNDGAHVSLTRPFDASCFAGLGGRTFMLSGFIRITDADSSFVESDGLNNDSPRLRLVVEGISTWTWNLPTNGDGTWQEFSKTIELPVDSSAAIKAYISFDQALKKEFQVKDMAMVLTPSEAPTTTPTKSPSSSPTLAPSAAPNPLSSNPTLAPQTAAPVPTTPTNLARSPTAIARADTECYNGWARKINDGTDAANHSCCGRFGTWVLIDLGKDTVNYIDYIKIKNRSSSGGRLQQFYVQVMDKDENIVWETYHGGAVGNSVIKTFTVNDGTTGRFVRLKYADTYKNCLHIAEMEVFGYPVELPANPPAITELALAKPTEQSSMLNPSLSSTKGNDGNFGNRFETQGCDPGGPWWKVDLEYESFIQYVAIKNRVGKSRSHWNCSFGTILNLCSRQTVVEVDWLMQKWKS